MFGALVFNHFGPLCGLVIALVTSIINHTFMYGAHMFHHIVPLCPGGAAVAVNDYTEAEGEAAEDDEYLDPEDPDDVMEELAILDQSVFQREAAMSVQPDRIRKRIVMSSSSSSSSSSITPRAPPRRRFRITTEEPRTDHTYVS